MCTEIGRPPVRVSLGTLEGDGHAPGLASVGYYAFGCSQKLVEVIGSRTLDNPAALDVHMTYICVMRFIFGHFDLHTAVHQ